MHIKTCKCQYAQSLDKTVYFFCTTSKDCEVHEERAYACDFEDCRCTDYKARSMPIPDKGIWPKCICGHFAQDHS